MKREQTIWMLFMLGVTLQFAGMAYAADAPAVAPIAKKVAASTSAGSSITTVEGSVAAVDLNPASPSLTVSGADGKNKTVAIDLAATKVWNGNKPGDLKDVKSGTHVRVRESAKGGKNLAKTIEILP